MLNFCCQARLTSCALLGLPLFPHCNTGAAPVPPLQYMVTSPSLTLLAIIFMYVLSAAYQVLGSGHSFLLRVLWNVTSLLLRILVLKALPKAIFCKHGRWWRFEGSYSCCY